MLKINFLRKFGVFIRESYFLIDFFLFFKDKFCGLIEYNKRPVPQFKREQKVNVFIQIISYMKIIIQT